MEDFIFSTIDVEIDKIILEKLTDTFVEITDEQLELLHSIKLMYFKAGFQLGSGTTKILEDFIRLAEE